MARFMVEVSSPLASAMELITILNRWHNFRGFAYHDARFTPDKKSIEVAVRPRKGAVESVRPVIRWYRATTNSPIVASNSFPSLAPWARRLSWKETADAIRTSWDKVFGRYVVTWGLEHLKLKLGQIGAIGVDEIQYAKGPQVFDASLSDRPDRRSLSKNLAKPEVYASPAPYQELAGEYTFSKRRKREFLAPGTFPKRDRPPLSQSRKKTWTNHLF
jgi:hypothetical protein